MSKLDEILEYAYHLDTELNHMNTEGIDREIAEAKQQIKDLMLEIIGEAESNDPDAMSTELRKKVGEL